MFNITDPTHPVLVGSYYTTDDRTTPFRRAKDFYPFLGPDRVLVSDSQYGLFVIDTTPTNTSSEAFPGN